jgi:thiosulfate/3-mercaptopyruvate sulfurtransferase
MTLHTENNAVCSAAWLADNLDRFAEDDPAYRLVEVDMDPAVYDEWHIPGAVQIDWEEDIVDGLGGTVVGEEEVADLLGECGITPETTVVLYGDRANWFAGHAYWVLKYYCHDDVKLLDGGRRHWSIEAYETTTEVPEYTPRDYTVTDTDESIRAYREEVEAAMESETSIIDVRNPQEYRGEKPPAEIPNTTDREGHIPTAENVPWGQAVNMDGTFKHPEELRDIYLDHVDPDEDAVAYCRIGERSSITWFVMAELLDIDVRNYDGSWTQWTEDEDAPVETVEPARADGGEE